MRADDPIQSQDAMLRSAQAAALDLARSADAEYGTLAARLLLEIARELGAMLGPDAAPAPVVPEDEGSLATG